MQNIIDMFQYGQHRNDSFIQLFTAVVPRMFQHLLQIQIAEHNYTDKDCDIYVNYYTTSNGIRAMPYWRTLRCQSLESDTRTRSCCNQKQHP